MSKRLTEEAERYFEDFISNVEDTDISSFDGERSDASSSLGGVPTKRRNSPCAIPENFESPVGSNINPIATDGLVLPWLQWETSNDGSLMAKNKSRTPITQTSLQWDAEQVSCTIGFINKFLKKQFLLWRTFYFGNLIKSSEGILGGKILKPHLTNHMHFCMCRILPPVEIRVHTQ